MLDFQKDKLLLEIMNYSDLKDNIIYKNIEDNYKNKILFNKYIHDILNEINIIISNNINSYNRLDYYINLLRLLLECSKYSDYMDNESKEKIFILKKNNLFKYVYFDPDNNMKKVMDKITKDFNKIKNINIDNTNKIDIYSNLDKYDFSKNELDKKEYFILKMLLNYSWGISYEDVYKINKDISLKEFKEIIEKLRNSFYINCYNSKNRDYYMFMANYKENDEYNIRYNNIDKIDFLVGTDYHINTNKNIGNLSIYYDIIKEYGYKNKIDFMLNLGDYFDFKDCFNIKNNYLTSEFILKNRYFINDLYLKCFKDSSMDNLFLAGNHEFRVIKAGFNPMKELCNYDKMEYVGLGNNILMINDLPLVLLHHFRYDKIKNTINNKNAKNMIYIELRDYLKENKINNPDKLLFLLGHYHTHYQNENVLFFKNGIEYLNHICIEFKDNEIIITSLPLYIDKKNIREYERKHEYVYKKELTK